jgi:hypothetical protein
MPQRNYSREQTSVAKLNKRVILPIGLEEYQGLSHDSARFRSWLDSMIETCPELFPAEIALGYELHDILPVSAKLPGVRFRRIKLKATDNEGKQMVLTVASSAVMPYMTALTDDVEKALFLRKFDVPFWALARVFGRDDGYWYRMTAGFGRHEIVGTTVKDVDKLPEDLLADEKHVRFNGEKGYIATTVGGDCVLGASLALNADEAALTEAYSTFREETRHVAPDYGPKTVNTDGWQATQKSWLTLFPTIAIIECFLHAFIKIRACSKKRLKALYPAIQQQVWDIYHASTPADFRRQIADFLAWSRQSVSGTALEAIEKLCAKQDTFLLAFNFPNAYRTSNMIDRHMDPMDRWLVSARFFHGHRSSAELQIRSWAILHNFWPYCPRADVRKRFNSPAHKLNGFVYHDDWLHNLLISSSCAGLQTAHRIH